jgi:predicted SprT family Zn-dependent metalloprotease
MKDIEIQSYVTEQSAKIGIDEPKIILRKMKTGFGVAYLNNWEISLNRVWVHKAGEIVVKSVILHEMLHLKNFWIRGSRSHDQHFKQLCTEYGAHSQSCFSASERRKYVAATKGRKS